MNPLLWQQHGANLSGCFLQVLFGQILQVPLAERYSGCEDYLILFTAKSDILAKVSGLSGNLDTLVEISFKVTGVHDTVFNRVTAVDGELQGSLLAFADTNGGIGLSFQGLLSWLLFTSLVGGSFLCSYFRCHGQPFLSSLGFSRRLPKS